jgi:hypothetical protein
MDKALLEELLQKHKEEGDLINLVREYCELASLAHLDENHEDRIQNILNLAIFDETLSEWIDKVDASIAKSLKPSHTD